MPPGPAPLPPPDSPAPPAPTGISRYPSFWRFTAKWCMFFQNWGEPIPKNDPTYHSPSRFFHPDAILTPFLAASTCDRIPWREKQLRGICLGNQGQCCRSRGSSSLRVPEDEDAKLPGGSGGRGPRGWPPAQLETPSFWDIPLDLGLLTERRAWLSDKSGVVADGRGFTCAVAW